MRFVGDRSYAFYLWHWPVLIIGEAYAGRGLSVGVKLLLLAGAFGLSIVSYALVENPIRRARWSASCNRPGFLRCRPTSRCGWRSTAPHLDSTESWS